MPDRPTTGGYVMDGPVDISSEFNHVLQRTIPGAEIRDVGNGIEVRWYVSVHHYARYAVNAEHAERIVAALAEQVRSRAIRELGLRPILDAMEAEVQQYREDNLRLRKLAEERAKRIVILEEMLEEMLEGTSNE